MFESTRQATRLDAIEGRYDGWLVGVAVALAAFGVVMVASASIAVAGNLGQGPFHYLVKHVVFLAVGIALCGVAMRTDLKLVEKYPRALLAGCVLLLLLVFIPGLGYSVNGARRWISFRVANFQVVEAAKVLYLVWLASYLVRFRDEVNATWAAMLKPIGVALLMVLLLLAQPDFGSATMLLAVTAGMLVLGGGHLRRMLLPVALLLPALVVVAVVEPYRLRRITSFWNPWEDQLGAGYQLSNALMAIGRGELTGVGLGASIQKLSYLPEAHTDFIFSVIAEELGLVGALCVIGLFAALVGRAFWIGYRCVEMRRHFAGYVAFGVALTIGLQALVSIGVNLGLLPTKGLTLPLISAGGSSVMMTCVAIGLLLRVSYELDRAQRQVARLRGEGARAPGGEGPPPPPTTQPPPSAVAGVRGTSRLRPRIEPTLGQGPLGHGRRP
ncbi:putative lipid II flippase FtsW [Luteimonas wenzhouensis]|uniref:Probable peptidoglycan glycosyltransferase FtsW n=1 Tax=Luteimonas wenzhouensis TaxID=2599615 RepID=A0A5C5U8E2_9GAMM|nr:putative lipid II flippase FtsW [Luteimonas wenzhouensis]NLW97810.1 putative lipid II flippase FtsW [Xanthomonadaceae bacterium]TWT22226.1 putative lipid II flippase FtsW [Luteimonas wenzhouensis]